MSDVIGIDLGTTMSVVAAMDEMGRPYIVHNSLGKNLTPSVVLIEGDERIVGEIARNAAKAQPANVADFVKRHMFDESWVFTDGQGNPYRPEEISAIILKKLKQDTEKALGKAVNNVVITVPAYFGDLERNRTKQAGEIAGFNVMGIINEPTAAAIAYGFGKKGGDSTILVYDLGGGTFDITILRRAASGEIKVLTSNGDKTLGGGDFDEAICRYFARQFEDENGFNPLDDPRTYQAFITEAEKAKIDLSSVKKVYVSLSAGGHTQDLDFTRDQFEELIAGEINRTRLITEEAFVDAKLSPAQIDQVLLVGGSTRIPRVQRLVKELTGTEPELGYNPDEVVALGAAIYAAMLKEGGRDSGRQSQYLAGMKVRDITAHSLGVVVREAKTGDRVNAIIIPKDTEIPAEGHDVFPAYEDNQTSVVLQIVQGEDRNPEECIKVGDEAYISGIPPRPKDETQIEVILKYDESGIVHLYAKDLKSGRDVRAEVKYSALLSQTEAKALAARVAGYDIQ